jgi:O-antigen/teichoic acid export membrane protein
VTVVEIVQSFSIIVLVWGFTARFGLVGAALAWLPTAVISQMVSMVLVRQILPRPLSGLGMPFLFILAATGACAFIAFTINNLVSGLPGFAAAILLAAFTFILIIWVSDKRFELGFVDDISRVFPQITWLASLRRPAN